jgi:PTS system galactitol-specific IIB component
MDKNILVICALGFATSTMVKKNIEDFLKENNIKGWKIDAVGVGMSKEPIKNANIIVSTIGLKQEDFDVPIVDGLSLISGINAEETLNEIAEIIKRIDE